MIHGGGHLTLSRRAVRPAQTKFLLANGILPVSLDYRLCPQVNVVEGAMTDVRDACKWAQRELPKIMASKGVEIDPSKYVVVGWSTGGTLAMTTSWTLPSAGITPPAAILSFYCPVNYDPSGTYTHYFIYLDEVCADGSFQTQSPRDKTMMGEQCLSARFENGSRPVW